jgi:hypothetical protein
MPFVWNYARLSVLFAAVLLAALFLYRQSWIVERSGDMDFYRDQVNTMNVQIYKLKREVRRAREGLEAAKQAQPHCATEAAAQTAAAPEPLIDIDEPGRGLRDAWQRVKAREGAASDKVNFHDYEVILERYLAPFRERRKTTFKVLEIGLGCAMGYGGARGWQLLKEYAPNVDYYAIELNQKSCNGFPHLTAEERQYIHSHTVWGDQASEAVMEATTKRFGPFDMIIDDGSHVSSDMIKSFTYLFEHALKPGRPYIIEDTFFGFIRQNGGSREEQAKGNTVVTMLRDLITLQQHYWWWTEYQHMSPMARRDKWSTEFGLAPQSAACATGVRKYRALDHIRTIDCDRGICAITKRHNGPFKHRVECDGNASSCIASNY